MLAIVDTNILSYMLKRDPRIGQYRPHLQSHTLAVTFVNVGELYHGARKAQWGERRVSEIASLIQSLHLLTYNEDVAISYGELKAERDAIGKPITQHDAWIAACALCSNTPLITHNAKDFRGIPGLRVITEYR